MVRGDGNADRVKLTSSNWIAIAGISATQLAAIIGVAILMWTRLAVVENEIVNIKLNQVEIRSDIRDLLKR